MFLWASLTSYLYVTSSSVTYLTKSILVCYAGHYWLVRLDFCCFFCPLRKKTQEPDAPPGQLKPRWPITAARLYVRNYMYSQLRTQSRWRYPSRLEEKRRRLEPRIFPTSLTGEVISEIAEDDWERSWCIAMPEKRLTSDHQEIEFFFFGLQYFLE